MTKEELIKEVAAKRRALRQFRFGLAGSKVTNVKEGRNIKKAIARLLTSLKKQP